VRYQQSETCRFNLSGRERIFALTVDEPGTWFFDARDDDNGAAIDTVLYVLSSCDGSGRQLACTDDVPCGESDIRTGCTRDGFQPRQSRLRIDLEPGTWYVVVESLEYRSQQSGTSFTCGNILLRASREP
jgi:hypothetical protein